MQLCSKPGGGTRNRTRDLPKKGSAFITSSDHWTNFCWSSVIDGAGVQVEVLLVGWLVAAVHGWLVLALACVMLAAVRGLTRPPSNKNEKKKQIGHHARPRRASATAPLRTGADYTTCRSREVDVCNPQTSKRCSHKLRVCSTEFPKDIIV